MPPALRGLGITFIITGLMAIGFMSFGGMLTGGDDEAKSEDKTAATEVIENEVKSETETENTLNVADNTNKL